MSDIGFLFVGYAVIWVALGGYLFFMGRREAGIKRDLERLEREISSDS
jgi:CcmD family protein